MDPGYAHHPRRRKKTPEEDGTDVYVSSHSVAFEMRIRVLHAVIFAVESNGDVGIRWEKDGNGSKITCTVGMVQLYSDKLKTSLKASALIFYPAHAVLLNLDCDS